MSPQSISIELKGIVMLNEHTMPILTGAADAQTAPFGSAGKF